MIFTLYKLTTLFPYVLTERGFVLSPCWGAISSFNFVTVVAISVVKTYYWFGGVRNFLDVIFYAPDVLIVAILITYVLGLKERVKCINFLIFLAKKDIRLYEKFVQRKNSLWVPITLNLMIILTASTEIYLLPFYFLQSPFLFTFFHILVLININIALQFHFYIQTSSGFLSILFKDLKDYKYTDLLFSSTMFQEILFAVEKVAASYSPQILFVITIVFALLTNNVYYMMNGAFNVSNVVIKASWLATMATLGYLVVHPCEAIKVQAKEFNILLYQIVMMDKSRNLINNKKLRLHVLMKREIVFTACGFFNVDYTLIHSIIASVTTYIVILVQFGRN